MKSYSVIPPIVIPPTEEDSNGEEPHFSNAPGNSSIFQRALVVTRPQWLPLMKRHVRIQEISGSLGDLGSFIPYTVNLANHGFVDFGAALVMAGMYNLLTCLWFDIPVAVQPMHTIAAVALSGELSGPGELMSAGLFVGACAMFLGLTGLIAQVRSFIPLAVSKSYSSKSK